MYTDLHTSEALARKYREAVQYSPVQVLTQARVHVSNGESIHNSLCSMKQQPRYTYNYYK